MINKTIPAFENKHKERFEKIDTMLLTDYDSWMFRTEDSPPEEKLLTAEIGITEKRLTEAYFDETNNINYKNIILNTLKKNYPQISKEIESTIDKQDLGLLAHPLIRASYTRKLAQKTIKHRDEFFSRLSFESQKTFTPQLIDLSDIAYMSYDTTEGILSYANSVNQKSYTLNADAQKLFTELLTKGIFDSNGKRADIHLLFAGLSMQEMAWAYQINKKNNHSTPRNSLSGIDGRMGLGVLNTNCPENIALIDSSIAASTIHNMFSGEIIPPSNKILSLYEVHDYLKNLPKGKKQVIIKHNGLSCEPLDANLREMEVLRYALNGKDATTFYTIPTTKNKTAEDSYAGQNIAFPYATLTELLLLEDKDIKKFTPRAFKQEINHDSFRYVTGFEVNESIKIFDQYVEKSLVLPKGTFLAIHTSNRYGKDTIKKMAEISARQVYGKFEDGMQVLF